MEVNNNISKELDYEQIKYNLNTSMEEDDISVSKELIAKTMARMKQDDVSASSTTSHKGKRKIAYNFSNVAAVVLLVLLLGTVRVISGDYFSKKDNASDERVTQMNENDKEISNEEDGDFVDSEEEIRDSEEIISGLVISDVIDIDITNIETLEVSYYEDKSVINKELTNKIDEVYALFHAYPTEEINLKEDETWTYKLTLFSKTEDRIYTITIGENITIIDENELSEPNQYVRRVLQVEEVDTFKAELEYIINGEN